MLACKHSSCLAEQHAEGRAFHHPHTYTHRHRSHRETDADTQAFLSNLRAGTYKVPLH